jgi:transcriptional regulator with GAF, ATPase, and Fis domain
LDGQRRETLWRRMVGQATADGSEWVVVLCALCRELVQADAAISLRADGRAQELLAATGSWATDLEETQYTLGEGPGVEAFSTGGPVLVANLAEAADRWPMFVDAGRAAAVAAVFAFPLRTGAIQVGTLGLYRRETGFLNDDQLRDATILADLATTVILHQAQTVESTEIRLEDLDAGSYQDVYIATGMLATQLKISLQDASIRLRAHAFSANRPLLHVSRDVLARRIPLDQWID